VNLRARTVAAGLGFPEGPVVLGDGSVLLSEMARGRIRRALRDGSVETVADVGGGPNGLALLADGRLVVCQSGGADWGVAPWPRPGPGSVEVFRPVGPPAHPVEPQVLAVTLDGTVTGLATTFTTASGSTVSLSRPSDVVADAHGGFYLTDFGRTRGRVRDLTGVLYGTGEGRLTEVVFPLEMPNGIALSPDGERLYVAETRTARVWEFVVESPGRLGAGRVLCTVEGGGPLNMAGADGVCVDAEGRIIVATLGVGGVSVFDGNGRPLGSCPLDDPLTTNAALGPGDSTLYVTLGSSGRLVALDGWLALVEGAGEP
jgi:gluconolactonase